MMTPIFIPMSHGSGHFDISSVHHPIIFFGFAVFPMLLTVLFFGLGILTYILTNDTDKMNMMIRIGMFFLALALIGLVIFAFAELISCI